MKKRTAFIGAILSLIPFGQPLIIKTGIFLSTTGITILKMPTQEMLLIILIVLLIKQKRVIIRGRFLTIQNQ